MTGHGGGPDRATGRWRALPRAVRWLVVAVLAVAVLVLLFTVVFPWLESYIADPTLGP